MGRVESEEEKGCAALVMKPDDVAFTARKSRNTKSKFPDKLITKKSAGRDVPSIIGGMAWEWRGGDEKIISLCFRDFRRLALTI